MDNTTKSVKGASLLNDVADCRYARSCISIDAKLGDETEACGCNIFNSITNRLVVTAPSEGLLAGSTPARVGVCCFLFV